jgi:hypothetical protein
VLSTLAVFAVVFITLAVNSYREKSATWDEPVHLTLGYAALTRGDYRPDPEHPPLLRLWAALPLLAMGGITLDTTFIDRTPPSEYAHHVAPVAQKFLFFDNDADRLLGPARFMIVLLGVGLGVMLFSWAYEWLGFGPAVTALVLYTVEPNLLAHASLVTTDEGATCFIFGTAYFLWRSHREPRLGNLAAVVGCFVLAVLSKFSALMLAPVVVCLLAVAMWRAPRLKLTVAAGLLAAMGAASWIGLWAVYGFRYAPSPSATWVYHFQTDADVQARVPGLAKAVDWIDGHRLVPNAYSQGLLISQSKAQTRPSFLAGQYSDHGWWYYFPVAFLIKTPIAVLLWVLLGLGALIRRRGAPDLTTCLCVILPPAMYVVVAMTARINIGVRHILPAYPFLLLLGAAGGKAVLDGFATRGRLAIATLATVGVVELAGVYPHTLTFFNLLVGGPTQGEHYLVDSNLDWGQDLKGLKRWMDAQGVAHINLAYFGTADPAYYHIDRTDLPGSQFFSQAEATAPRLPGYVAISATVLSGVYFDERGRSFYQRLRERTPLATIGNSIHVYWVERPWW